MAEDLLVEITKLYEELEGPTPDYATAVDNLCADTIENKIKESLRKNPKMYDIVRRYFSEYAKKLLRIYAKKLKPDLRRLKNLSSSIDDFLQEAEPSSLWAGDIYRLRDDANEALAFFTDKLWFLPDRGDRKQLDRWIFHEFRKWYDSDPLDKRFAEQASRLQELTLSIPSAKFHIVFPENPETIKIDQVSDCSLCNSEDPRRIRFCKRCSKDNIPCYSCFRKHAWSRQHDEYRVFSELRNIDCPYCRSEFVIGDAYTVIQCK